MSIYPKLFRIHAHRAFLAVTALATMLIVSCTPIQTDGQHAAHAQRESQRSAARAASAGSDASIDLTNQDSLYVGEKVCMECHEHAAEHAGMGGHAKAFRSNPRTPRQAEVCETCHGPGSKHIDDTQNNALIIGFTKVWGTPVAKQNAQCLTCHQGGQRLNWVRSTHDANGVACSDCHNPMLKFSPTGALQRTSIAETCYNCHPQQRSEFLKRSHMPVPEGKMSCEDCHNPHGSPTKPLLKADTVNEACYTCHAEKRGPFIWEHSPVRENCANCHLPHGSNNDKLLVTPRPFLCQQCHSQTGGHAASLYSNMNTAQSAATAQAFGANTQNGLLSFQSARVIGRSCQNCHSQVHGSNHPAGARFQR
jgi:DmsE family decaheme c-type cytochrome